MVVDDVTGVKRATGVQLANGDIIQAKREVILSTGSYRTPQVLMLSGIGPASELQKHGIKVQVDSPEVYHDHLTVSCYCQSALAWMLPLSIAYTVFQGESATQSKEWPLGILCGRKIRPWRKGSRMISSHITKPPGGDSRSPSRLSSRRQFEGGGSSAIRSTKPRSHRDRGCVLPDR